MGFRGAATSGMGPRGAAEGPRGTATWDRVIKGLHALSHNNCKTLIQAPSGTLDIRLFKIRLNSPRLGPSADRRSPFPLEWKEWKGVRNKQFLDKKYFNYQNSVAFFPSFTSTARCNSAWRHVKIMPSKMEVASQHCDTIPNKTKDILDTVQIEKIC